MPQFVYLGINGSCHERQLVTMSLIPKYYLPVFRFCEIDQAANIAKI